MESQEECDPIVLGADKKTAVAQYDEHEEEKLYGI